MRVWLFFGEQMNHVLVVWLRLLYNSEAIATTMLWPFAIQVNLLRRQITRSYDRRGGSDDSMLR